LNKNHKWQGNLSEKAYTLIRRKILRGEFSLGSPLSRRNLASLLGMSMVPISEAVQRLEQEGLVESRPRVGTRVRIPTMQDLRDLNIVREALESQSARLFAEKASSSERQELRKQAARLDAMIERCSDAAADTDTVFRAQMEHLSFHMRIAECTGCVLLRTAIEQNQVLVFNWLYDVATAFRLPQHWHQDLMAVVAEHDPNAADAAMRAHVRYGVEEIQPVIASDFGLDASVRSRPRQSGRPVLLKTAADQSWRLRAVRR
jgi:DNA-binding GntR family transcriptional regulator